MGCSCSCVKFKPPLFTFSPLIFVPFGTKLIKAFLYLLSHAASTHLVSQFAVAINAINNIRQSNPLLVMKAYKGWRYNSTGSGYTCGQLVPSVSIN